MSDPTQTPTEERRMNETRENRARRAARTARAAARWEAREAAMRGPLHEPSPTEPRPSIATLEADCEAALMVGTEA